MNDRMKLFTCRYLFDDIDMSKPEPTTEINEVHIATALIALKSKHHLSNMCIDDIISFLHLFTKNAPSSYKALCTVLRKRSVSHMKPIANTICPYCGTLSVATNKCTSCDNDYLRASLRDIPLFYTYDIGSQIEAILATSSDISFVKRDSGRASIGDIIDGDIYQSLLYTVPEMFLTLSMNVDGIQPNKGSEQSLWPILMVINEIPWKKRFSLENLIIAGMWPGPSKPNRKQMSLFFENIVKELVILEQGRRFQLYSTTDENTDQFLKIFLIASCCDKPAQCLIQCLPEPTAYFGCGSCEIKGQFSSMSSVVFPMTSLSRKTSLTKRVFC